MRPKDNNTADMFRRMGICLRNLFFCHSNCIRCNIRTVKLFCIIKNSLILFNVCMVTAHKHFGNFFASPD